MDDQKAVEELFDFIGSVFGWVCVLAPFVFVGLLVLIMKAESADEKRKEEELQRTIRNAIREAKDE